MRSSLAPAADIRPDRPCSDRGDRRERLVEQLRVVVPDPDDARVLAEPRVLAAREPPGRLGGALARLLLGELTAELGDDLAVADGPRRGATLGQAVVEEVAHLLDEAAGEHGVHSDRDALVERLAVDVDTDLDRARVGVLEEGETGAERLAGQLDDLEGADDAAAVLGQDLLGRLGVALAQQVVERLRAAGRQLALPPGANRLVGARELEPVED